MPLLKGMSNGRIFSQGSNKGDLGQADPSNHNQGVATAYKCSPIWVYGTITLNI